MSNPIRHQTARYTARMSLRVPLVLMPFLATMASAQTRTADVIYMKAGGTAFTMDVLKPAKPNKAAVVFMVSGGWMSDHSMLQSFMPDIEKVFVDAGFTVFEVVHGAQPRFKVGEIVEQVRTAVRFVHTHAADYGIDTNRVGVSGISSGGHLALMIAGSPDSPVKAVAAIAPPTDLANWGKPDFLVTEEPQLAMFVPALGFDPKAPRSELEATAKGLSPIALVTSKFPSTLIVHGDDDKVVPLQQAQAMDGALAKAGVDHKLEVIPGGGHDEKAFGPGLLKALQWFKDKLLS
ncbi:alpha/beta hydrolase [bacterium]|nr:MAG: alpha/beta hydrolase [bacterium]